MLSLHGCEYLFYFFNNLTIYFRVFHLMATIVHGTVLKPLFVGFKIYEREINKELLTRTVYKESLLFHCFFMPLEA